MASEPLYDLAGKRVWVAGHRGMVGASLVRRLEREACEIVTVDRARLDLRRQAEVEAWVADARPQAVFLAAARPDGHHGRQRAGCCCVGANRHAQLGAGGLGLRCGLRRVALPRGAVAVDALIRMRKPKP